MGIIQRVCVRVCVCMYVYVCVWCVCTTVVNGVVVTVWPWMVGVGSASQSTSLLLLSLLASLPQSASSVETRLSALAVRWEWSLSTYWSGFDAAAHSMSDSSLLELVSTYSSGCAAAAHILYSLHASRCFCSVSQSKQSRYSSGFAAVAHADSSATVTVTVVTVVTACATEDRLLCFWPCWYHWWWRSWCFADLLRWSENLAVGLACRLITCHFRFFHFFFKLHSHRLCIYSESRSAYYFPFALSHYCRWSVINH